MIWLRLKEMIEMITFRSLKVLLNNKGITQVELSKRTGIRYPTISAICNDKIKKLPINVIEQICSTLNCAPGDWIKYEENKVR